MKLTYFKNPLNTVVELDDRERETLWFKVKINELNSRIDEAYFTLTNVKWYNETIKPRTLDEAVAEAVKALAQDENALDARVDELTKHYIEELRGVHVGDCTCVACSCSKCWAESLLGIDTIAGLGKHSAYKINDAFGKNGERTMQEALAYLAGYKPTASWLGWETHAKRWKAEADAAYAWLKTYSEQHPEL